jgi:DNA-directed RNA polymerase subunit alpha
VLITQRPILTEEPISEFRSRFVLEPLEPGFGYTLGNSMRRTLLSSIPGAAVTSIRIDGVLHEFTTIPGVKEDVTELILNIKQLVVSSDHDEPVVMYLRKQGPGAVVAADIAPPAGVEVHNPDLHIATLNDKGKLEMELVVERGRGYVSATLNKQPGQEIGRIPVDSIYSPVLKVTYKVEATRVEQRTDFDKLVLDVETKPSMLPRDAVASAGKTLVELFGLARELNVEAEGIDIGPSPADAFVAADGVRSSCRLSLGCGAMTNPGRVKEIVAHVRQPLLAAELGQRFLKVLDPSGGLAVGLVPLGDDRLVWFVQFDSQRFSVPQPSEVGAFLEAHFGQFPAVVRHVLAATEPARAHVWHTVDEDPATRWSKGNVALAGDAAHPLLPFTSQGVNTALEDAVLLSDLLLGCRDAADVPELFSAYERQRRPALLGCVEAGRQMARDFVQPSVTRLQLPLMA